MSSDTKAPASAHFWRSLNCWTSWRSPRRRVKRTNLGGWKRLTLRWIWRYSTWGHTFPTGPDQFDRRDRRARWARFQLSSEDTTFGAGILSRRPTPDKVIWVMFRLFGELGVCDRTQTEDAMGASSQCQGLEIARRARILGFLSIVVRGRFT